MAKIIKQIESSRTWPIERWTAVLGWGIFGFGTLFNLIYFANGMRARETDQYYLIGFAVGVQVLITTYGMVYFIGSVVIKLLKKIAGEPYWGHIRMPSQKTTIRCSECRAEFDNTDSASCPGCGVQFTDIETVEI